MTRPNDLTDEQIRELRNDPDRAVARWARRATDRRLIGTRRAEARRELCAVINARSKRCTCPPSPVPTFDHEQACPCHPANWNKREVKS